MSLEQYVLASVMFLAGVIILMREIRIWIQHRRKL